MIYNRSAMESRPRIESEVFSYEVNNFASVWNIVQPLLQDPPGALTEACTATMNCIATGNNKIVRDLQASVDDFGLECTRLNNTRRHQLLKAAHCAADRTESNTPERALKSF
jgi:hypothetical protein